MGVDNDMFQFEFRGIVARVLNPVHKWTELDPARFIWV